MLKRGKRRTHPRERRDIATYIEQAELPVFEPVLQFGERSGGIEYRVRGATSGLWLGLVWTWGVSAPNGVEGPQVDGWLEDDGRYLFECAIHPVGQVRFTLDQSGTLNVDEMPIASSVEVYIESDSVLDSLTDVQRKWMWLLFGNAPRGDRGVDEHLARSGFVVVPEASDEYITWWRDTDVWVHRHMFWDGEGNSDRLNAYARTKAGEQRIIEALLGTSFGRQPTRVSWP